MAPSTGSSGQQLLAGSLWMIAMRWSMRLIGLFSLIILARLLVPDDFGIIAMAMIIVGLLETIAFTGVDLALIRDDQAGRDHYDAAWTIKIIQGTLVAALLLLAAPLAGDYFNEPRVVAVIQLLALKAAFDGLENIGVVAFRKELNFAKEFRFNVYKKLINFFVVIAAAVTFSNYWALAIGIVSASAISTLLSYVMHPYRPRLSAAKIPAIWSFSQWLLASRIGYFLNNKASHFIVGNQIGTTAMGSYHLATEVATMPSMELVMPMRRALFPVLSKTLDSPQEFRSSARSAFATIATLCCLLGFGLAAVSDLFVPLVLGEKWLDTTPLLRWMALFGVFSSFSALLEMLLWVRGETRLSALLTWLELLLLIPLILVAVDYYGIEGAAAGRTLVAGAMVPLAIWLVARSGPLVVSDFTKALWRPLIAGAVMAAALMQIAVTGNGFFDLLLMLLVKLALGALLFTGTLLLLWQLAGRPAGIEAQGLSKLMTLRRA